MKTVELEEVTFKEYGVKSFLRVLPTVEHIILKKLFEDDVCNQLLEALSDEYACPKLSHLTINRATVTKSLFWLFQRLAHSITDKCLTLVDRSA